MFTRTPGHQDTGNDHHRHPPAGQQIRKPPNFQVEVRRSVIVGKSPAKVAGHSRKVAGHSRKVESRWKVASQSRSLVRVGRLIVASRVFQILPLQVFWGHLISKLLIGRKHHLLLVHIAHIVLHEEDTGNRVDLSVLHIVFHLCVQNLIRLFNEVATLGGNIGKIGRASCRERV